MCLSFPVPVFLALAMILMTADRLCAQLPTVSCQAATLSSPDEVGDEQVVTVDCFLEGTVNSLRQYQVTLPCCWTPEPGATGSICQAEWSGARPSCTTPVDLARCAFLGACGSQGGLGTCNNTVACVTTDPGACFGFPMNCVPINGIDGFCRNAGTCRDPSPYINRNRPDYAFLSLPDNPGVNNGDCVIDEEPRLANALPEGFVVYIMSDIGPKYMGSFVYKVSECASGSFHLPILCGPFNDEVPCGSIGGAVALDVTRMNENNGALIPYIPIGDTVTIAEDACCECSAESTCRLFGDSYPPGPPTGNCLIDVNDILCVLDGFAGLTPCNTTADIYPCPTPNGVVDVDDILATLDAFAGNVTPPCAHPCAGACCTPSGCTMANENGCEPWYFLGYGTQCGPGICP